MTAAIVRFPRRTVWHEAVNEALPRRPRVAFAIQPRPGVLWARTHRSRPLIRIQSQAVERDAQELKPVIRLWYQPQRPLICLLALVAQ